MKTQTDKPDKTLTEGCRTTQEETVPVPGANEFRLLAEKSSKAASEATALLAGLLPPMEAIQQGNAYPEQYTRIFPDTYEAMSRVIGAVERICALIHSLSEEAEYQAQELNELICQITTLSEPLITQSSKTP